MCSMDPSAEGEVLCTVWTRQLRGGGIVYSMDPSAEGGRYCVQYGPVS